MSMIHRYFNIINFAIYQAALLLALFYQHSAVNFMLMLLVLHFVLSPSRQQDMQFMLLALIGATVDQVLVAMNVLDVDGGIIPFYLLLLWCALALTFNHSLRWITTLRPLYIMLTGAIAGPLSYYSALKTGALDTPITTVGYVAIYALVWLLLLPLLSHLAQIITYDHRISHE
ncbi:DUF2878 domain-containing protein [Moritella sp. Urea-trap-13]|uniref:DUF2878 domain-containing protein n=1 Tax=Moritella sp. Urea-trap-13 TaxID=2058327 RepID=UPI000C346777|nr:DUF2878 domain-containing protein [Moritella sp. Urea-trap-13]PKH07144.1 DUF2878 domain-containing protein [Moritella sp. Urea-trap-13]